MMASCGDADNWNPLSDDFNDETFNSYGLAATSQGVSSSTLVQLFVAGIPPCLTEQGLINLMSPVAKVRDVKLIAYRNIGFVSVLQKDAVKVIAYFNNYKLGDSYLTVKRAKFEKQIKNEPSSAVSGTATRRAPASGKEQQREKGSDSTVSRFVVELELRDLLYPTAAKHVQVGQILPVKVLNVVSPSQFWICRDSTDADGSSKELHTAMQKHYSNLPPKTGFTPNGSGLYAAAVGGSGNWCRVQALNFDTESVSVLLLDYGTCEQVGLTDLHSLEGQFCSLPFQAICCSLAHIECTQQWSEEAVDYMRQMLSSQEVHANVCSVDRYTLSVELILSSGQTVSDVLVNKDYASYVSGYGPSSVQDNKQLVKVSRSDHTSTSSEDTLSDYPTMKDLSHVQLTVGEQYDVVVLHAGSVSDVTVCLKSSVNDLTTLTIDLSSYQFSEHYVPHVGEIVAAEYAIDASCYRAEVSSLNNDGSAVVHFVDFGNTATVDMKSVVRLQPRHMAFPVFGIKIKFRSSDVDSELLKEFCNLNLKVVEERDGRYVVDLVRDDAEMHVAESPPGQRIYSIADIQQSCLDTGKTYKAWVTDATDVEKFYIQFDYQALDEHIQAIYSNKSGGYMPQQTGELIAIHLDLDDAWYRAVVIEIENKNAIKCQLIDFGIVQSTTSKDISRFDGHLLQHPVAAFKCTFHNAVVSSVDSWKKDYVKPMDDVFNVTVVEVRGDLHFVKLVNVVSGVDCQQKLIDDGVLLKAGSSSLQCVVTPTVINKLPSGDAKQFAKSNPEDTTASVSNSRQTDTESSCDIVKCEPLLPSVCDIEIQRLCHNREKVIVVHATSPSDFYVQSGSDSVQKKLASLQQSINTFCRQSAAVPDTVAIGQIVGVMHEDGFWYRGEVLDLHSHGKYRIHLVDFGVTRIAEYAELRSLPDELAVFLPRQSFHCAIDRIVGCEPDGSWSDAIVQRFHNICKNCDFTLKSIFKNDSGSIWLVDLLCAGRTVKEMLLAPQLNIPRASSSSKSDKSVSKYSPVLLDVDGKQISGKTSPPLLSNSVTSALIQADETVTVTFIHSPGKFFVQKQHQSSAEVFQELNSYYKADSRVYRPKQVGELIAVMHNEHWYRAEVLALNVHSADVFFIDCGYIVTVDVKNCRALPLRFATALPKLAICCALGGINGTCADGSYSEAASAWFRDNYLQVASTVTKVKSSGDSALLLINLKNSASSKTARQSLLDYGMAVTSARTARDNASSKLAQSSIQPQLQTPCDTAVPFVEPSVSTSRQHVCFQDAAMLHVDAVVCVVFVISPADFYVLPAAVLQEVFSLSEKLAESCTTSNSSAYHPQYVGEPVAAKFEEQWYRAEVVKLLSNDRFEVSFVDFGNTEIVGACDLSILSEEFVKWPKQAVSCGLDGACGTDSGQGFSAVAVKLFKEFCSQSALTLSSVRIANKKHLVNIDDVDGKGAKELLIAKGLARPEC